MLYITLRDGSISSMHIGQCMPLSTTDIVEIQADGDELDHIYNNFKNIPICNKKIVTYFGDMAKFIVENW